MDNGNALSCSINMEWLNPQGITQRKLGHKTGFLRLVRSNARDIFLEVIIGKLPHVKLKLKAISVHKKFMNEGKATIKFQEERCTVMLSNAPPNQLMTFLRTMFVKMTGQKDSNGLNTSLRTQLLSKKSTQFEEISPVTNVELDRAQKKV